ncbi:MAG TPA: S4 domain-containing protein, partial [Vicinamibacteria bacterium]|nr:S4 domain-containing protein [Vicinamibacteria bacterium]
MKERLQKILANAGIASRRAAEKLIEEGRVEVDGRVVKELGTSADPDTQEIRVDGTRVRSGKKRRYVALHKPKGYVTTRSDPGHRPTVMELLPQSLR